jgi:membrane associated rhomboid family serine protease
MAAMWIFITTIVISLLGLYGPGGLIDRAMLRPYWVRRKNQYDRLLTSGFVHADVPHLLFNMVTFYFFAFAMERYVGPVRFLVLYFSGLLVSSAGSAIKHRNDPGYATLGASGAILAVMFASIVYSPHLLYSFYASKSSRGRVNHDAHFAGALVGLAFVAVTDPSAYEQLAGMLGS